MNAETYFKRLVAAAKSGGGKAVCSVCSSNALVIEAALEEGRRLHRPVLIEATANQINQFGGYTGMTPADFREYVLGIAGRTGFDSDMLLLGGDHLGPLVWCDEDEHTAMDKACELVRQFAAAGFSKIHLDCSMRLGSDETVLPVETAAARTAFLCGAAEEAAPIKPVYVVGSEVPIPGGATQNEETVTVTKSEDLLAQVAAFRAAFAAAGLSGAWERVIAAVVQPGVEFGDDCVFLYDPAKARALTDTAQHIPGIVLEGHSTDYQPRACLQRMARDGIIIQKVGPALTFELRNALFALEEIERRQYPQAPPDGYSRFSEVLEEEMLAAPENWNRYYRGDEHTLALMRKFSLSDRCRYYLDCTKVRSAAAKLMKNVDSAPLSRGLMWQYLPRQAQRLTAGEIDRSAATLVKEAVKLCLRCYE